MRFVAARAPLTCASAVRPRAARWHVRFVEETKNVDIPESQAVLALLTAIPANFECREPIELVTGGLNLVKLLPIDRPQT
jgi:hypothetical protein